MGVEKEGSTSVKLKQTTQPPPPPPLPKTLVPVSFTNQEIAKFWRQKRVDEEDHLLAAIKAAARIRASKLTEDDYKRFEAWLKEDDESKDNNANANKSIRPDENNEELHVGIKDWWTKSKYAYLNQPAIQSMDKPKRRTSTYIPNFCNYKPSPMPTTSFGVF
ncbi:uncharacterized protein LOC132284771 [Cornus florida]|uniref:uncharacterized protein LOC132284771 n=1 Tax=Cornus florida TaxID=4283 RepID=UPI00289D8E67|nr:uncharacterized protein LOC132284771 [Cornus florida]